MVLLVDTNFKSLKVKAVTPEQFLSITGQL